MPLADSIAALSPLEYIHFNAPKSKKNMAITTAITRIKVITADIIPGMLVSFKQRKVNGGSGHTLNPAEAAGVGVAMTITRITIPRITKGFDLIRL